MEIFTKKNNGFKWYKNDSVSVKGYFYDSNNIFYEKQNAVNFLSSIRNLDNFKFILPQLNGVFTIILFIDDYIIVTSDITRSFPVFYTIQKRKIFISDDVIHLKNKFQIDDVNDISEIEFKASKHVHGKKTLFKNLFQVQPSECLIIQNNNILERFFTFSYSILEEENSSYDKLREKTINTFENGFKRFIKSLNNRTVLVPLSGGFDSRLIAVMLRKHNYTNVICYTYGRKSSFEIENSKKTAKALGFQWYFIEYNHQLIGNFINTNEFKEYVHYAGKLSSMPYMQEYFAIKYLKENNLISLDAIFVPGFAGDLLGGSQFLKVIPKNLKKDDIKNLILKDKFSEHALTTLEKENLKQEIEKTLIQFDENYLKKIPSSVFEDYDIKEKIAKYIFNSASFYTFFGYEFRFPFWDKELLNFFKTVPVKYKDMKTLFDDVLINEYFKTNQVYFESELQPSKKTIYFQKVKDKIKPISPPFIKQKLLQKSDWNNYEAITQKMLNSLKKNNLNIQRKYKSYNEIITQWYIHFSKKNIHK